jgi:hypothetical protein
MVAPLFFSWRLVGTRALDPNTAEKNEPVFPLISQRKLRSKQVPRGLRSRERRLTQRIAGVDDHQAEAAIRAIRAICAAEPERNAAGAGGLDGVGLHGSGGVVFLERRS